MRLDVQGAATIRKLVPNCVSVFLSAESEEALVRRLHERKSETAEGLRLRVATARREIQHLPQFDYVVVNAADRREQAVDRILAIIEAEHCRVDQEPIVI
jgi:guanylate kinase